MSFLPSLAICANCFFMSASTCSVVDSDPRHARFARSQLSFYGPLLTVRFFSLRQCAEPRLEKPPLRLLPSEVKGAFVGSPGLCRSSQTPTEIRPHHMRHMVVAQRAVRKDTVNQLQSCQRAVAHRHRYSTIQFDHR